MGVEITIILRFDGFAIRRQKMSKPLCAWGFAIPSNRFGSFVIGGLQIRRDGALLTVKKNLRHLRNLRDFKKQQGCSDDFSVRNRL